MPSQTFLLAQQDELEDVATHEPLPGYTQHTTPPSYFTSGHAKQLSIILEDQLEQDETRLSVSPAYSWELARLFSQEYATMLPQALLIDASATLCAYLYFTSLQARLAIEQHTNINLLHSVCAAISEDADASAFHTCARAIAHQQAQSLAIMPSFLSHHLIILTVFLKAILGYAVLQFANKYVRPFDYLVASSAAHCLVLYCFFFVPVANLSQDVNVLEATLWLQIVSKFFWLMAICSSLTLIHWYFGSPSPKQDIALSDNTLDFERKDGEDLV